MYRMLTMDIDDTLLRDDLTIGERTRKALENAMERGVHVTLATGRMYASAKQVAGKLGLNVPIITYQGALVTNLLDGEKLYERPVPVGAAREILQLCEERGLHLQLYIDDELIAREDNDKVRAYSRLSNVPYRVEPDFEKLLERPSLKMLVIDEPEELNRLMPVFRDRLGGSVHMTKSKPHYLEFMHPEGTKGQALAFLARHFGLELRETIAFGDSWNDRDMLEMAGLGVAMGNAVEELKKAADIVTASNNEDGIADIVETHILRS